MQIKTERGLILVEAEYASAERAQIDGYSYAFYSEELKAEVYSKIVDNDINKRTFAIIRGYC